jgi:hypothetical protein
MLIELNIGGLLADNFEFLPNAQALVMLREAAAGRDVRVERPLGQQNYVVKSIV